jgi:hypothetical protein
MYLIANFLIIFTPVLLYLRTGNKELFILASGIAFILTIRLAWRVYKQTVLMYRFREHMLMIMLFGMSALLVLLYF